MYLKVRFGFAMLMKADTSEDTMEMNLSQFVKYSWITRVQYQWHHWYAILCNIYAYCIMFSNTVTNIPGSWSMCLFYNQPGKTKSSLSTESPGGHVLQASVPVFKAGFFPCRTQTQIRNKATVTWKDYQGQNCFAARGWEANFEGGPPSLVSRINLFASRISRI